MVRKSIKAPSQCCFHHLMDLNIGESLSQDYQYLEYHPGVNLMGWKNQNFLFLFVAVIAVNSFTHFLFFFSFSSEFSLLGGHARSDWTHQHHFQYQHHCPSAAPWSASPP